MIFLSTLSLRRATYRAPCAPCRPAISIHALLAESDNHLFASVRVFHVFLSTLSLRKATAVHAAVTLWVAISIHALLAESDYGLYDTYAKVLRVFLSTLSLRRATRVVTAFRGSVDNFYPRSPCGERHHNPAVHAFSHAFLSTLSLRRATIPWMTTGSRDTISIHALLAESDVTGRIPGTI